MGRSTNAIVVTVAVLCGVAAPGHAGTLAVGPGKTYSTISAAVAAAHDGDTVVVQTGVYLNDFPEVRTRISLLASGGRVTMAANVPIPNGKGILLTDTDTTVTGFDFVGARVSDDDGANGAGIRYQGGALVLNQVWVHGNQEGLLANPDPNGTITINASEFDHNGDATGPGAGYTHNLYVGNIRKLDIEASYFHHARVGHEIKSRALTTIVNATRVVDGPHGTASYSIDLPNGGNAAITGCQIEQGPNSENPIMVAFGEEGSLLSGTSLTITATLLENDLTAHGPTGVNNATSVKAKLATTSVYGLTSAQLLSGPGQATLTQYLSLEPVISTAHPF